MREWSRFWEIEEVSFFFFISVPNAGDGKVSEGALCMGRRGVGVDVDGQSSRFWERKRNVFLLFVFY